MKILLLGANGQLGHELQRSLAPLGELHTLTRADCDFGDLNALSRHVESLEPTHIVNAAAYTAVDRAESEIEVAQQINWRLPERLAHLSQTLNSQLIHFSTDYVYHGEGNKPFTEECDTTPLSVYGQTKLAGDEAILDTCDKHLIFRVSWVYSTHGHNFLRTMLRLAEERDSLRIVADQIGAPTPARLIADTVSKGLSRIQRRVLKVRPGVYNLACAGEASWYDFAREIFRLEGLSVDVEPISSSEYPTPATRPLNSRMDTKKLEDSFCILMPSWQSQLATVLQNRRTPNTLWHAAHTAEHP